jgi:hypothetical protein
MSKKAIVYGPGCQLSLPFAKLSISYRRPGNEMTEDDRNIFVFASPSMIYWIGVHGPTSTEYPVFDQEDASNVADRLVKVNIVLTKKEKFPWWLMTRKAVRERKRRN